MRYTFPVADSLILYDCSKRFWIEAGAADQGAVDFFFGHKRFGILRFHRAAVEDAKVVRELLAESFSGFSADQAVGLGGDLRRSCLAGSNGPDGLVGDHEFAGFLAGNRVKGPQALAAEYVFRQPRFAFFQNFANANNRS